MKSLAGTQASRDNIEFGLRLLKRYPGPEAADDLEEIVPNAIDLRRHYRLGLNGHGQRQPNLCAALELLQRSGRHADDGERLSVNSKSRADDIRPGVKLLLPIPFAEDRNWIRASLRVIRGGKQAAIESVDSQYVKEIAAGDFARDTFADVVFLCHFQPYRTIGSHAGQGANAVAILLEKRIRS